MRRLPRTLLAALVLLPVPAAAQAGAGPPGAGGVPAARIDSVFLDLDRTSSPGCAAGVVRDGALVFAEGYGSANLDHEIPIAPETVFYMASVSKQFTAGAVLRAARQGHLSLDDDIRTWVPELPDHGHVVTVRHLVHHTSGIRDYLTLQSVAGSFGGVSDEDVIALLARQKALNFAPGERYLYSNSGYFLMAEIVERATGLSLREYAEREFFRPLGMRDSHFHDDADHVVRNRATAYEPDGDGYRMNHAWNFAQVGSGGLYSNVVDMARWDAAFEADEVGDAGFREAMLEPGALNSGEALDYAFGLSVVEHRGLRTISHGGSLSGFRSHMLRFPDERLSVIVLCNVSDARPGRRAERVAELILGDRLGPAPVADEDEGAEEDHGREAPQLAAADVAAYVGRYYSEEIDAYLVVRAGNDGLVLRRGAREQPLVATGRDEFGAGSLLLRFVREGGGVSGFVLDAGRANGLVFERAPE